MVEGTAAWRSTVGSIRFRLTAIAAAVVAAVLIGACVALVVLQTRVLTDNLDGSLEQRVATLAANLGDLNTDGNTILPDSEEEDRATQIAGPDGRVIAATPNLAGIKSLVDPDVPPDGEGFRTLNVDSLDGGEYRVLTREVDTPDGVVVVHVAQSTEDLTDAVSALVVSLLVAVPVVVVLFAAGTWWLTGLTLRPVEQVRREVDEIVGDGTGERVRVPPRADEISRLAQTMNEMLDRVDRAAERQSRFVADAAHELRSPLTRIRTELEVDLAHPDTADPPLTNRRVLADAESLQHLIDDLLLMARTDADQLEEWKVQVDLDDLVLAEVANQRALGAGVALDVSGVSAAHFRGDPEQLSRAVRNLLANAVRHGETTVSVELSESDSLVCLVVADDGPGIAAEDAERVFERFTRLDDARSRIEGGTGLGLAIVRDIVESHDGTVVCDTSGPTGTRFMITLPVGD